MKKLFILLLALVAACGQPEAPAQQQHGFVISPQGGTIVGTGTANTIPWFTSGFMIGNSPLTATSGGTGGINSLIVKNPSNAASTTTEFALQDGTGDLFRIKSDNAGSVTKLIASPRNTILEIWTGSTATRAIQFDGAQNTTLAGTITTTRNFTSASGINDEIYIQDTQLATSGDGIAIHFTQGNAVGTYNTKIASVNTNTSPSFLNPKLVFYIQNGGTTGTGNMTNEFEITNAGIHTVGTSALDGAVTTGSTLTTTGTTELGTNGSSTKIDGNLIMAQPGTDYIYSSLATSTGTQSLVINAAGIGEIDFNTGTGGFTNAGSGGVALMPGGSSSSAVWRVSGSGNQTNGGTLTVTGASTFNNLVTVNGNQSFGLTASTTPSALAGDTIVVQGVANGTIDATATSRSAFGVVGESYTSRSAGANSVVNYGGYFDAIGGQISYAVYALRGNVALNVNSGTTAIGPTSGGVAATATIHNTAAAAGIASEGQYGLTLVDHAGGGTTAGVGGGIALQGTYSGSTVTTGAVIRALKHNATSGDYSFDLSLATRLNGSGTLTEVLRLNNDQTSTFAGRIDYGASGAISYTGLTDRGVLNYDTSTGNLVLAAQNSGGTSHVLLATSNTANAATQLDVGPTGVTVPGTLNAAGGLTVNNTFTLATTIGAGGLELRGDATHSVTVQDKDGTARPGATTCGTGPTVVGNDTSGYVTTGTGATACTLTWNQGHALRGCVLTARSGTQPVYTPSNTTLVLGAGTTASATYDYYCEDH